MACCGVAHLNAEDHLATFLFDYSCRGLCSYDIYLQKDLDTGYISGDYINADGWSDFTDKEAELAYNAFDLDSIKFEDVSRVEFDTKKISYDDYCNIFLYDL